MVREVTAIADKAMWIPVNLQPLYLFSPWLLLGILLILPALGVWLLLRGTRPRTRVNGQSTQANKILGEFTWLRSTIIDLGRVQKRRDCRDGEASEFCTFSTTKRYLTRLFCYVV